jgi:predicted kinase
MYKSVIERDDLVKKIIIMRGLPGSGKSTRALRHMNSAIVANEMSSIVSADDYFTHDGLYDFNPSKLRDAHADCFSKFLIALIKGHNLIVVDNTNTQLWEFENYLRVAHIAGYEITIDEAIAKDEAEIKVWYSRCVHGVPFNKMQQMQQRWQTFDLTKWKQTLIS